MNTMDPIHFDTHRFVKRMTGTGMPLVQAEELADVLAAERKGLLDSSLATLRDVEEVKRGHAVVKAELDIVKWIVSGGGLGIMLLLIRILLAALKNAPVQATASPAACRSAW